MESIKGTGPGILTHPEFGNSGGTAATQGQKWKMEEIVLYSLVKNGALEDRLLDKATAKEDVDSAQRCCNEAGRARRRNTPASLSHHPPFLALVRLKRKSAIKRARGVACQGQAPGAWSRAENELGE